MNKNLADILLPDGVFEEKLNNEIKPYLKERYRDMSFKTTDGAPINGALFVCEQQSRGCIFISHGFTEFIERYDEVIYTFLKLSMDVAICDHRGHGHSHRELENLSKVHIKHFDTYARDFKEFYEKVKGYGDYKSLYLFGHSMGGAVAARYIELYPRDFKGCILSSPMMEVISFGFPKWMCSIFAGFMVMIGRGTSYLGSQDQDFKGDEQFEGSCATSYERWKALYDMRFEDDYLKTCAGTIEWMKECIAGSISSVKNAGRIQIPVILFQAENDNMVLPGGQERFVSRSPYASLYRVAGSKHEIVNSDYNIRMEFWTKVLEFLDNVDE